VTAVSRLQPSDRRAQQQGKITTATGLSLSAQRLGHAAQQNAFFKADLFDIRQFGPAVLNDFGRKLAH